MIGPFDDLRDAAGWAQLSISSAGFLVKAANADPRQVSDLDWNCALDQLRIGVRNARQAITPRLANQLIQAHYAVGDVLPPVVGCNELSATALAMAISQGVLDSFLEPAGDERRHGTLAIPLHISGKKEFQVARPKLRGLTLPDTLSLGRLIDREIDAAASMRVGIIPSSAPVDPSLPQTAPVTQPGGPGGMRVPWQDKADGFVTATNIIRDYRMKQITPDHALNLTTKAGRPAYDRFRRVVVSCGVVVYMTHGPRLKVKQADWEKLLQIFRRLSVAGTETPAFAKTLVPVLEERKGNVPALARWECASCEHELDSIARPQSCPKCLHGTFTRISNR